MKLQAEHKPPRQQIAPNCPALRLLHARKVPPQTFQKNEHTNRMQYEKIYVGMLLHVDPDGNMKPVELEWTDGTRYPISRVIDKRSAPPAHVGSAPTIRYTVLIQGRERVVYYEKFSNRWFVEKQV